MFETALYYGHLALAAYKALAVVVTVSAVAGFIFVAYKNFENGRSQREHVSGAEKGIIPQLDSAQTKAQNITALRDKTIMRWRIIIERLSAGELKDYKTAIIEADGLVDEALRALDLPGETMGERMQALTSDFVQPASNEDLWNAHKVRNDIAHNPHYTVSPRQGHDMMRIYKKVLEELGAL